MNPLQVVITRDLAGNLTVGQNPTASTRDVYELLGVLRFAEAVVMQQVMGPKKEDPGPPGLQLVTGPAAAAVAAAARRNPENRDRG